MTTAALRRPRWRSAGRGAGAWAPQSRTASRWVTYTKPRRQDGTGCHAANARLPAQAPTTGPKATEDKTTAPKPRPAATAATAEPDKQAEAEASPPATARETTKPPVDPVVAKLNSYAAARGEPKDTVRAASGAKKVESYANAGSGAEGVTPAQANTKPKPGEKADVGEGEAGLLAHDEQHRGEGELVIVADAVGGADEADDANITGRGNGSGGHGGGS